MTGDLLQAALDLARLGLRPVPMIAHAKCPALKGWRERASLDPQAVADLFADASHATGLAVATGCGVFVVDLDRHHANGADGVRSFAALIAQRSDGHALALGPRVRTPRGGVHLHFAHEPGRTIGNRPALAPGVDVKGAGGLAMAPPSPGYRWTPSPWDRDLPPAPAWLLALIDPPKRAPVAAFAPRPFRGDASRYARAALERELSAVANAQTGARNQALYKASAALGSLAAAGMLPIQPVAASLQEAAVACGLIGDDGEAAAHATIASGLKRGLAHPRQLPQRQQ